MEDGGDPSTPRIERRAERERIAFEEDVTLVGADGAGEHLYERALAGAVLTNERVDLALLARHARPAKRLDATE